MSVSKLDTSLTRVSIVQNGVAKPFMKPRHQMDHSTGRKRWHTTVMTPTPPTTSIANGADIIFEVPTQGFERWLHSYLQFNVTAASDIRPSCSPHWVDEIQLLDPVLNTIIQRVKGDVLRLYYETLDSGVREQTMKRALIDPETGRSSVVGLEAGTHKVDLMLAPLFMDQAMPYLGGPRNSLSIKIVFNKNLMITGSATDLSLNSVAVISSQHNLSDVDNQSHKNIFESKGTARNLLEFQHFHEATKTWSANVTTSIALEGFNHRSAALFVMFRNTIQPSGVSDGLTNCLNLGDDCMFELVDASGTSVWGGGTATSSRILVDEWKHYFPSSSFPDSNQVYCISFVDNVSDTLHYGTRSGELDLRNNKYQLQISQKSAGVAEIQKLNCTSAANDRGVYRLQVGDDISPPLAYNATAAAIKAAVEALPVVKQYGYTVTASGVLSTDIDITFDSQNGSPWSRGHKVRVIADTLGTAAGVDVVTTELTTRGKCGAIVGAGFACDIYSAAYTEVAMSPNGSFTTRTL